MSRTQTARKPVAELPAGAGVPTLGEIGLDGFAPYLLNRIAARWNADLQEKLRAHGLNTLQMRTLATLSIMSGATVNELSIYAVTEQWTMSRTLDGLERDGLIRRALRPGDMRVREVHITGAGRATFERFWPEMHEALEAMMAGISEAERKVLLGLLTRMLHNIRKHEI